MRLHCHYGWDSRTSGDWDVIARREPNCKVFDFISQLFSRRDFCILTRLHWLFDAICESRSTPFRISFLFSKIQKLGHFNGMQTFLRHRTVQVIPQIVVSLAMGRKLKSCTFVLCCFAASGEAEALFSGLKVKSRRLNILQLCQLNGRIRRRIRLVRVTGIKFLQLAVELGKVRLT